MTTGPVARVVMKTYQIKEPVTVVTLRTGRHQLVQLPPGSIFQTRDSKPDRNGMIDGFCRGDTILMFSRDLEDRAMRVFA
jgi:hypothetical protein